LKNVDQNRICNKNKYWKSELQRVTSVQPSVPLRNLGRRRSWLTVCNCSIFFGGENAEVPIVIAITDQWAQVQLIAGDYSC
jgi:hypothetical protein